MQSTKKLTDQELIDKMGCFIKGYISKNTYDYPVVDYHSVNQLKEKIDFSLPDQFGDSKKIFESVELYLKYCVKTGHPQFFNQLWSGFNFPGFVGEVLTALTNTSMYTYEVAPIATLIEESLIQKFLTLIGFPETGGGTFVTGGSNGNLLAMLIARNKFLDLGNKIEDLCVFYSDKSHYSLDTAAMIVGIPKNNIIKVPTGADHRINADVLDQKMKEVAQHGKVPFFVSATAGTTVAGKFDPIFEIAHKVKKYKDCWLHVDGAHGGCILLSRQHKHLLKGIELADSMVWDGHKVLGAPLICSMFLLKEKEFLNFQGKSDGAKDYLFHSYEESGSNLGTYSLQCGRRADCIKLWLMWNYYGTEGLEFRVNRLMDLARYAENKINFSDKLELAIKPEYVNVCFRYKLENADEKNDLFHNHLKEFLYKNGISMVNTASVNNKKCIRLVISNPDLQERDIDIFFENILEAAEHIVNNTVAG